MADVTKLLLYAFVVLPVHHLIPVGSTTISNIVPTPTVILVPALWRVLPGWVLRILDRVPNRENEILRQFRDVAQETARQTIKNVARDNHSKDIVTLLGRCLRLIIFLLKRLPLAKASDERLMDEDEILSQLAY